VGGREGGREGGRVCGREGGGVCQKPSGDYDRDFTSFIREIIEFVAEVDEITTVPSWVRVMIGVCSPNKRRNPLVWWLDRGSMGPGITGPLATTRLQTLDLACLPEMTSTPIKTNYLARSWPSINLGA